MSNKKATKRALLTSVMALALCVVMLVGTTFAWFTDTAKTNVNKIQAGNLDVALYVLQDGERVSAENEVLNFVKAEGAEDEEVLWEPGCTYQLPALQIVNEGNLALKYKIQINGAKAADDAAANSLELLDVLTWTYEVNGQTYALDTEKSLGVGANAVDTLTIKAHMDEQAGNKYMNMAIDGITITVYATQDTVESDSYNNQYDKDAKYTEIVAEGKSFTSGKHTLTTGVTATNPNATAVKVDGADVTILDGTFDGGANGNNKCVWVASGTLTIKDGTFTVGGDADGLGNSVVYSTGGAITIEGGFFYTNCAYNNKYYVLNQNNSTHGTITVKGGTFVNYNPATGDDNLGGNFVADGYSVISETKANGDVWYTVVKGTGVTAGTQDELKDNLLNKVTAGEPATIVLSSGDYTLYNVANEKTKNTTLTIVGNGAENTNFTVGKVPATAAGEHDADYSFEGSEVTFKNMTINVGTKNYMGFIRAKSLYFENCTIVGMGSYWGVGDVTFKNCVFESDNYNMWTYSGMNFAFDGCTFKSSVGKFINAYKEQTATPTALTFNNCQFIADTTAKPAVCLKGNASNAWNVSFTNCDVTGCATDTGTNSQYYYTENTQSGTTVTVDGTVVYPN